MRMPVKLFVKRVQQSDGEFWLEAREDLTDFEEEGTVGVYELTAVEELKIQHILVGKKVSK